MSREATASAHETLSEAIGDRLTRERDGIILAVILLIPLATILAVERIGLLWLPLLLALGLVTYHVLTLYRVLAARLRTSPPACDVNFPSDADSR